MALRKKQENPEEKMIEEHSKPTHLEASVSEQ